MVIYIKKILVILLFFCLPLCQDIACVGNSITANGYPEIIDFWMSQDGLNYDVYNFGVPGITVAIDGFNYKNTTEYQDVLNLKPQHVIVMLGSNDWFVYNSQTPAWGEHWENEYRYIIESFNTDSKVFLGTITYRLDNPEANSAIESMNERIRKMAQEYGMVIIDFNSAIGTNSLYFQLDGIHPNADGKRLLAKIAYDILKTYPIYCVDTNWNPDASTVDEGLEFIQTSNCGTERTAIGTKPIELGIDDEYWDVVEDYEDQQKIGWFGCQSQNE
jgi:acyl-CoA thioesterase I